MFVPSVLWMFFVWPTSRCQWKNWGCSFSCKSLKLTGVFIVEPDRAPWIWKDEIPTLSSVSFLFQSLHPYQLLCLSVFLQEEKGISCGLVDLDFLKCSVGFPFMRAQTKVAHADREEHTKLILACSVALLPILSAETSGWLQKPPTKCIFLSTVSFCSDFWHQPALRRKWHPAVFSSGKKVSVRSVLARGIILNTDQRYPHYSVLHRHNCACLSCFSANPEHKLSDNSLDLSIPLIHETDTTITG